MGHSIETLTKIHKVYFFKRLPSLRLSEYWDNLEQWLFAKCKWYWGRKKKIILYCKLSQLTAQTMKPFSRLFLVPNAHLVENDRFKWPPYRRGTNEHRPELLHFSTLDSSTASPLKISTSSAKCVKLLSSPLSNVILRPISTDGDTLAPTEPCPPCKKQYTGVAQREAFGFDSEKSRKKEALEAEVEFLFKFQISYKDERMLNPNSPPSPSKWRPEHYQRGEAGRPRFSLSPQRHCKYSYFPYKEQWAGSHGGSEWSTIFSLEQTALRCIC